MKNKKKFKSGISIFALVAGGLLAFQNCTDMRLKPLQTRELASAAATGSFCSMPAEISTDALNVIFVVDMSNSNLWSSTGTAGTDKTGVRFDLVQNFLTSDCLKNQNKARFAVYGFSDNTYSATCDKTMLGDTTQARAQIDDLRNKQTADASKPASGPFQYMKKTHYGNAFGCAKGIVESHLASLPTPDKLTNSYMVFFLTDGLPTDNLSGSNYNIPATKSQLQPVLTSIMQSATAAGGGRIQPIFYGQSFLTSTELPMATDILDFISTIGDSNPVSVDNVNQIEFCQLLASGRKTKFIVKDFGIINLTAKMRDSSLHADSDMDGLTDDEETARGFDPTKPRSGVNGNLLLDGLCPNGFNASNCPVSNACSKPNKMGLSDCDIAVYSLTDGLDSDKDLIPDFVEILKGSSPNTKDRYDIFDGDSLKLFEEIRIGRDPKTWDDNVGADQILSYRASLSQTPIGSCPANQESYSFNVDHIPLVHTLRTQPTDYVSKWNRFWTHSADENVIFIYYIVGKANDDEANPAPYYIYGQFVPVDYKSGRVNIGNFELLGTMNGTFTPIP